jgi:hypothetical protein
MEGETSTKTEVEIAIDRTGSPKTSGNSLANAINWLGLGDIVILHINNLNSDIYHVCADKDVNFDQIRVVKIDCVHWPDLPNEDEWPWYFESGANAHKCTCGASTHILEKQLIPHIYSFVLPASPNYIKLGV